jgi:hypothetical protein
MVTEKPTRRSVISPPVLPAVPSESLQAYVRGRETKAASSTRDDRIEER